MADRRFELLVMRAEFDMGVFGWSYPPGCSGTPYDDEPDIVEEAEKYLHELAGIEDKDKDINARWAESIIAGLLDLIEAETDLDA